ncbi:hypothetical protein MTR_3g068090 [Medicago truncatula]|uniref:Uncharacterized protein n=1 Tax=Medicago truncatula TaxID=3880 RepID=A0A072V978_MEDTR|nr:hypothetical protein MTR_3g068090 [Medicago truncatula]
MWKTIGMLWCRKQVGESDPSRRKPYVSRVRLEISNLPFNDSLSRNISSTKNTHLDANFWICYLLKVSNMAV